MYNNYFQYFPIFLSIFFSYVIFPKHFFTNVYSSMLPCVLFHFVFKEPISIDTRFTVCLMKSLASRGCY